MVQKELSLQIVEQGVLGDYEDRRLERLLRIQRLQVLRVFDMFKMRVM